MPLFVTVTPGTTVTASTVLTPSTLNLLGTPSVDVTGSVDGGTLSVADGSLTLSKFAPITANRLVGSGNSSSYPLELSSTDLTFGASTVNVATGAITETKLGARAATFAKVQAIDTGKLLGRTTASSGDIEQLSVGTGLTLSGGTLSNGILRYTTSSKSIPVITSGSQAVQWLTTSSELPSLSVSPQMVRVVLECTTNDGPFVVGNEIDIQSVVMQGFKNNFPLFTYVPTVSSGVVSGSNIFLNVWFSSQFPGNATPYADATVPSKMFVLTSAGAYQELTRASWKVKAYLLYASTWA